MYFFQKNKFKLIIAAITLVLVVIMAVSSVTGGRIPLVSDAVSFVVSPFQKAANSISGGVTDFFAMLRSNKNYARENEELKKQIASLEDKIRQNDSYALENARLRSLLELKEKETGFEYVAADVIASDLTNWSKTFTVAKGLVDGVSKDCAVVTANGVVGYVSEVGRTWAKVVAIIDSSASVGATITRLNVNAVVSGDLALAAEGECVMNYLTKDTNVEIGDYAVTSGIGGIYPQGLYIGKVVRLEDDASGLAQAAIIEPGVDFFDLSEVLIIKK